MSKEIKYRVWSIKKRKYIDIDTLYCANGKVCGIVCDGVVYDIDNVVLEQDTALKDKNGKEIYEGDIIAIRKECAVVFFDDTKASFMGHFCTRVRGIKIEENDYIFDFVPDDIEIIGNIHENPELLEKGEKNE